MPLAAVSSKKQQKQIFAEQLKNCGVDYFDFYLLHDMDFNTIPKAKAFDSFDFIRGQKSRGLVRNIGFSFHDTPNCPQHFALQNTLAARDKQKDIRADNAA